MVYQSMIPKFIMTVLNNIQNKKNLCYNTLFTGVILTSLLTKLFGLDLRTIHYDEAIHLMASWKLFHDGFFESSAWMHGPLQIELVSLLFQFVGDTLYSGRLIYAIFGCGLCILPLLLVPHINKISALIMSVLLTVSPSMLYMSRFARNDIIVMFLSMLLFITLWKYILTRKERWLVCIVAILALIFSTKETSYFLFTAVIFGLVIGLIYFYIITRRTPNYTNATTINTLYKLLLMLITLTIPMFGAITGIFQHMFRIVIVAPENTPNALTGSLTSGPPWIDFSLITTSPLALISIPIILSALIIVLLVARPAQNIIKIALVASLGLTVFYAYFKAIGMVSTETWYLPITLSLLSISLSIVYVSRSNDKVFKTILLSSASLIFIHALVLTSGLPILQTIIEILLPGQHIFDQYISFNSLVTTCIIFLAFVLSIAAGLLNFSWKWIVFMCMFYGIIALTYTTYFANSQGFYTGIWQSLGYWMSQQEVARGNQPWYYYIVGLSIYEFLPLVLGAISITWAIKTRNALALSSGFWAAGSLIFFTIASEKMPWLLIYIALPLIIVSSIYLGSIIEEYQRKSKSPSEEFLLCACVTGIIILILAMIYLSLSLLILSLIGLIIVCLLVASAILIKYIIPHNSKVISLVPIVLILLTLTGINSYHLNYKYGDEHKQFMVYAQGSHEIGTHLPTLTAMLDSHIEPSTILMIDYDIWYPLHWYFRDNENSSSITFNCFKSKGEPGWNEQCIDLNEGSYSSHYLLSEDHHNIYSAQLKTSYTVTKIENIIWFPEVYRRTGENRAKEKLSDEIINDFNYFKTNIFNITFWSNLKRYQFNKQLDSEWFQSHYYHYERMLP